MRKIRGRSRRWAAAVLSALCIGTGLVAGSGQARADITDPAAPIVRTDAATLGLNYNGSALGQVLAAEGRFPPLAPVAAQNWLATTPTAGAPLGNCPTRVQSPRPTGFCWAPADASKWRYVPQGLTTSAETNPASGLWRGRRIVGVSWSAGKDHASGTNSRMRVSFTDVTDPDHPTYRSALLVAPAPDGAGFVALPGHADTLAWYGDHLFVYGAQKLLVFDLNHLWATTTGTADVGVRPDGSVGADSQEGVLPQVGEYTFPGGSCGEDARTPCFAAGSIDNSQASPALVTMERNQSRSRVVRWPLDPATTLLRQDPLGTVRAEAAYLLPFDETAGVAMRQGRFVVTGDCPNNLADVPLGEPTCLYQGTEGRPLTLWTQAPAGIENVSYDAGSNRMWVVNETPYYNDLAQPWVSGRVAYTIPLGEPFCDGAGRTYTMGYGLPDGARAVVAGDYDGDGCSDLGVAQSYPGGQIGLFRLAGRPDGSFDAPALGWQSAPGDWWFGRNQYVSGDFDGDGKDDIAGLYGYANGAVGLFSARSTGTGFEAFDEGWAAAPGNWEFDRVRLLAGDFDGDGRTDIGAVYGYGDASIGLWIFTSKPKPGGGVAFEEHLGWKSPPGTWGFDQAKYVAGDFDGDGKADIGAFYGYGDGRVRLFDALSTGTGFRPMADSWSVGPGNWDFARVRLTTGDYNGDGRTDIGALYDYGSRSDLLTFTAQPGVGADPPQGRFVNSVRTFSVPDDPMSPSFAAAPVVSGDVNGDGRADVIAVASESTAVEAAYTMLGQGPSADDGFVHGFRAWRG